MTNRPFRDKPGYASNAAKVSWANMTPDQRSERARNASLAAAAKRTQQAKERALTKSPCTDRVIE